MTPDEMAFELYLRKMINAKTCQVVDLSRKLAARLNTQADILKLAGQAPAPLFSTPEARELDSLMLKLNEVKGILDQLREGRLEVARLPGQAGFAAAVKAHRPHGK